MVSLSDLLSWQVVPRTSRPLACVTFDDGYLDNYSNAAPILMRHEIPAAFFVSTGIVGTDRRFPRRHPPRNPPIPVMQWDHVRELHRAGFLIGSHTVNHIDCEAEPEDVVRAELEQSREDLRRELGLSTGHLLLPIRWPAAHDSGTPRTGEAGGLYRMCVRLWWLERRPD